MSRARISDTVLSASGTPVVAAAVTLLRANDFADPPTTDPGSGYWVATTVSGGDGSFFFDHLVPDDYHVMVQYGGQAVFRYFVPALPVEVAETRETRGRNLVPRALGRLLAGEDVTIYAVGDDVTLGYDSTGTVAGSWVHRLGVLIGQQLAPAGEVLRYDPGSFGTLTDGPIAGFNGPTLIQAGSGSGQVIQIVNCSVKNDTVQRVFRRADANLLTPAYGPVDLFLIQLGLNDSWTLDGQRFVDPTSFAAGLRALVESMREHLVPAEIGLLTVACSNQPDAGNGGTIPADTYALEEYAMATRRVALETGAALVDLRQLFADRLDPDDPNFESNDGYGNWLATAGDNHSHPTDAGHQAIAEEVFKLFGTPGLAPGRPMRIQPGAATPARKTLEVCRLGAGHPAMVFGGGHWSEYTPSQLGDLYVSGGALQRSQTASDTMTFVERMVDVGLLTRRGPDCGRVTVAVDGGPPETIDLYRGLPSQTGDTTADGAVYPAELVWLARGLADAVHTVLITVLGEHDSAASAGYVYVDGIHWVRAGSATRRVETVGEANARIQYGAFSASVAAASAGVTTVTFAAPFLNGAGITVLAVTSDNQWYCSVQNITESGVDIHVQHRDGTNATTAVTGTWLAIG